MNYALYLSLSETEIITNRSRTQENETILSVWPRSRVLIYVLMPQSNARTEDYWSPRKVPGTPFSFIPECVFINLSRLHASSIFSTQLSTICVQRLLCVLATKHVAMFTFAIFFSLFLPAASAAVAALLSARTRCWRLFSFTLLLDSLVHCSVVLGTYLCTVVYNRFEIFLYSYNRCSYVRYIILFSDYIYILIQVFTIIRVYPPNEVFILTYFDFRCRLTSFKVLFIWFLRCGH